MDYSTLFCNFLLAHFKGAKCIEGKFCNHIVNESNCISILSFLLLGTIVSISSGGFAPVDILFVIALCRTEPKNKQIVRFDPDHNAAEQTNTLITIYCIRLISQGRVPRSSHFQVSLIHWASPRTMGAHQSELKSAAEGETDTMERAGGTVHAEYIHVYKWRVHMLKACSLQRPLLTQKLDWAHCRGYISIARTWNSLSHWIQLLD